MIWTVFPKDDLKLPQDFSTKDEAQEYADELNCDYEIECTTGEVV